mmetsp:Transcript_74330/g.230557  ORF Transcript_74330/g.230557 Transcript_74330/m.230557 type:complete len:234 (+) Transcript_74330:16-717(+)
MRLTRPVRTHKDSRSSLRGAGGGPWPCGLLPSARVPSFSGARDPIQLQMVHSPATGTSSKPHCGHWVSAGALAVHCCFWSLLITAAASSSLACQLQQALPLSGMFHCSTANETVSLFAISCVGRKLGCISIRSGSRSGLCCTLGGFLPIDWRRRRTCSSQLTAAASSRRAEVLPGEASHWETRICTPPMLGRRWASDLTQSRQSARHSSHRSAPSGHVVGMLWPLTRKCFMAD